MMTTVIASARINEDVPLPSVSGFITSRFNPLVNEVARRCLANVNDITGPGTLLLMGTVFGDTTTSDTASRNLVAGEVHNPLLFFQSVPTTILGYIAHEFGITGPIVCISASTNPAGTLRAMAELYLLDDEIRRVLMIEVELAVNARIARLGGTGQDTATATLLRKD